MQATFSKEMKKYQHNPNIFRSHFAGQGLPAFKGRRLQQGYGLGSLLKRVAIPLLSNVTDLVAPMLVKGTQHVVEKAMKRVAPRNRNLQKFVSENAARAASFGINKSRKAIKRQSGSGNCKSKRRKRDIFE